MQFVPSFDFGAAVQGVSKGMDDWQKWSMFPLEQQLTQARLDNAQMDLATKGATQTNTIDATNSGLQLRTAQDALNMDLMSAGRPGKLAQADSVSRSRVAMGDALTPDMLAGLAQARVGAAVAAGDTALIDAQGALDRAGDVNTLRTETVATGRVQNQLAQGAAQGELGRQGTTQAALNNEALTRFGLSETRLAMVPEMTRNMVAAADLDYRKIMASKTSLDQQKAAGQMMEQTYALTRQYADMRMAIGDPNAINNYVAFAASQGRVITPDQAKVELDQRSTDIARSITALQGRMSDLVRNNDTSNTDQQQAQIAAGRALLGGQPAASGAVMDGGAGVFRSPAASAASGSIHAPNPNPPTAAVKPQPVRDWSKEKLLEERTKNPEAQKELDKRNTQILVDFVNQAERALNPAMFDFGMAGASAGVQGASITPERRQELMGLVIQAKSDIAAIKERQKIEKELLEQRLNKARSGGDLKYPELIGGR